MEMRSADVVESQDCRFANLHMTPGHALAQHEPKSLQGRCCSERAARIVSRQITVSLRLLRH